MNEQVISHYVLGLDPNEQPIRAKHNTFCTLCKRAIALGDPMFSLEAASQTFCIHIDCLLAVMTKTHNKMFRQDVKMRPQTRRTQRSKKTWVADERSYCSFCPGLIDVGDTYVKEGKKKYHDTGRRSCWFRYKQVLVRAKNSV